MLTVLKAYVKLAATVGIYLGGYMVMVVSIVKEAKYGLFLLVALIPQANIWHRFHEYPFGKDFLDFLYIAIVLGMIFQRKGLARTGNSGLIFCVILVSYLSLWNSCMRFSLPMPITYESRLLYDWKNYAQMIGIYFLVVNIVKTEEDEKTLLAILALVVMFISVRSIRGYSPGAEFVDGSRYTGPFWKSWAQCEPFRCVHRILHGRVSGSLSL